MQGDIYSRLLERSRINIAVHFGPRESGGWQDAVSIHTLEIPACKSFMLHVAAYRRCVSAHSYDARAQQTRRDLDDLAAG